jgi:thioredoxin-related protein
MKHTLIAALVFAAAFGAPMMHANPEGIEWKSITQALDAAPKQGKLIVLDVYTDWCGWCKRMDRDTYADSGVAQYLNSRFVASKMNPEKEGKLTYDGKEYSQGDFAQALNIHGYPATVFFNEKGEVLTVVPGYIGAKDFLPMLKYFGDGVYTKGIKYEDYIKNGTASTNN